MKRQWTLSEADIKKAIQEMLAEMESEPSIKVKVQIRHTDRDRNMGHEYSAVATEDVEQ